MNEAANKGMLRSVSRGLAALVVVLLALVLGVVLYLQFGNLNRHRPYIQNLVSAATGRDFRIEGDIRLELFPTSSITTGQIMLANAPWGSQPQMLQISALSASVNPWSLAFGPPDVKTFVLSDVVVLQETNAEGQSNWDFTTADSDPVAPADDGRMTASLPLLLRSASLERVVITRRQPESEDQTYRVDQLTLQPTEGDNLVLKGTGQIFGLPLGLAGEISRFEKLQTPEGVDIALTGSLGKLDLTLDANVDELAPLSITRLSTRLQSEDLTEIMTGAGLKLPLTGPLDVNVELVPAQQGVKLELDGLASDITIEATADIRDSGIEFAGSVTTLGRLGVLLEVDGLPDELLELEGRVELRSNGIRLEDVIARVGNSSLQVSGDMANGEGNSILAIQATGASLADLRADLPAVSFAATTDAEFSPTLLQLENLDIQIGDSDLAGSVHIDMEQDVAVRANLKSRKFDLTPLLPPEDAGDEAASSPAEGIGGGQAGATSGKFVFVEKPLPFEALSGTEVDLKLAVGQLSGLGPVLEDLVLDGSLHGGTLNMDTHSRLADGGVVSVTLEMLTADDQAKLETQIMARDLRINIASGDIDNVNQIPPTSVTLELKSSGGSPRELASAATGSVLVTQGSGRVDNSLLGRVSGDILAQLATALNPMAKTEQYSRFECTIIAVEIVDGQSDLGTFIVQGEQIMIVAGGKIDLDTEALNIEFNTSPREGIGISADMFVTPFVALKGTLAVPVVGLNEKGTLITGGAAVATGGLSLIIKAVVDRAAAAVDHCVETLPDHPHPPMKGAG